MNKEVTILSGPIVVKIGGAAGVEPIRLVEEIPALRGHHEVVLVHGGSEEGDHLLRLHGRYQQRCQTERGIPVRITDEETLRILTMAWAGGINKRLVSRLAARGVPAVGLSGADGGIAIAKKRCPLKVCDGGRTWVARDHLAGEIELVNTGLLRLLLAQGLTPVLCPPAITSEGCLVNVDADLLASAVAGAIGASSLVLLSNIPGVLTDADDQSSVVRDIDDLAACRAVGRGGMQYKLEAASRALDAGVELVCIGPANTDAPVSNTLAGKCGTRIRRGSSHA
jgi:[amino group carrier protein]-L-2-aminoadipate 6-kinase